MANPILRVTNGSAYVDMISNTKHGILLNEWSPSIAKAKGGGTYQNSALASGRRLVNRQFDNVVESFSLKVSGISQDRAIYQLRTLMTLLEEAVNYWTTIWHKQPVWIEARAPDETNTRYCLIQNYQFDSLSNPYAQPFFSCDPALIDDVTVAIERGHWLSTAPGSSACTKISWSSADIPEEIISVAASADDGHVWPLANISNAGTTFRVGKTTGLKYEAFLRFTNIDVPNSAKILSAHIEVVQSSRLGSVNDAVFRIHADDTDSSNQIVSYADYQGRTKTTAYRDFFYPYYTVIADMKIQLPDMTSVVQEVVDRGGWSTNNDMQFLIAPQISPDTLYVDLAAQDHGSYTEPILHITYAPYPYNDSGSPFNETPTCDKRAYIVNGYRGAAGFTHIYQYTDTGPVWSTNRIGSVTPYELLAGGTDNATYFGIESSTNPAPVAFNSIILDLVDAFSLSDVTIQHYSSTGWQTLTDRVCDNTEAFSIDGINSIHIVPEIGANDWEVGNLFTLFAGAAPNVEAYWIRVVFVSGVAGSVDQQNNDPYIAQFPSVVIDSDEIEGDLPSIGHLRVYGSGSLNPSDSPYTYTTRIISAISSMTPTRIGATSELADFQAFIPMSDRYTPGIFDSYFINHATGWVSFVDAVESPTGRILEIDAASAWTMQDMFTFKLSQALMGRYHIYMRTRQAGGATSDYNVELTIVSANATQTTKTVSPSVLSAADEQNWELHDFGIYTLPYPAEAVAVEDEIPLTQVTIRAESINGSPGDLYILDIIFMPVDEWIGEFVAPEKDTTDGALFYNDYALDIDSISNPKIQISSNVKAIVADFEIIRSTFTPFVSGDFILPSNSRFKLWVLGAFHDGTAWISYPDTGYTVELFKSQRYLGLRGDK